MRDLTLQSTAPTLVYEEGSLVKRSIRDLYNKDIDEVLVAGDGGFDEAKDFMRMLMPSHAKNVKPYRDGLPIFTRFGIESQLDAMFQPVVQLRSGGYIVINQTEALVAIDVNSGRATREHHIEDTALKTNIEAAEEIARQLRLRDLAGLIVIDFIDMDEKRNNRAVERRLKDALKHDRARIQVGHISHFGLMEMSRQRIRSSVLESSTDKCPHCGGSGHVRSVSSVALQLLRALEEMLLKGATHNLIVRTRTEIALYLLNQKRAHLRALEERFQVAHHDQCRPDASPRSFPTCSRRASRCTASNRRRRSRSSRPASPRSWTRRRGGGRGRRTGGRRGDEERRRHEAGRRRGRETARRTRRPSGRGEREGGNGRKRRRRRGRRGEEREARSGAPQHRKRTALRGRGRDRRRCRIAGIPVAESAEDEGEARPRTERRPPGRRSFRVRPRSGTAAPAAWPARRPAQSPRPERRRSMPHRAVGACDRRMRSRRFEAELGASEPTADGEPSAHREQREPAAMQEQPAHHPEPFEHRAEQPVSVRETEPRRRRQQPAEPAAVSCGAKIARRRSTVREPAPIRLEGDSSRTGPAADAAPEPTPVAVEQQRAEDASRPRRSGWWSKKVLGKADHRLTCAGAMR